MSGQIAARPGRRPGRHDTRAEILSAARACFGRNGYQGTTMRRVAAIAGIDAAMVHRHFGTKQRLLLEAVGLPDDLTDTLAVTLAGDSTTLGARIVRSFVEMWDSLAPGGAAFRGLLQLAASSPEASRALGGYLDLTIGAVVARVLGVPLPAERAGLVGAQLLGIAVARYLIRVEPAASATPQQLAAELGWIIQRLLTGAQAGNGLRGGTR